MPDDAAVFIRIVKTSRRGDHWELTLGRPFASVLKFALALTAGAFLGSRGHPTFAITETLSRLLPGLFR
jgi:hypothetical protein